MPSGHRVPDLQRLSMVSWGLSYPRNACSTGTVPTRASHLVRDARAVERTNLCETLFPATTLFSDTEWVKDTSRQPPLDRPLRVPLPYKNLQSRILAVP